MARDSRSGAIPEPTVTVRMKRERDTDLSTTPGLRPTSADCLSCFLQALFAVLKQEITMNSFTPASQLAPRIAFIQACWHKDIVDQARQGFVDEVRALGQDPAQIDFFEVGGAFEIPLHAKRLAQSGQYAAVVAAGLVVDGGIYRHDFVATAVIQGLMQVQLETGVPVFSVVLTPHHFHDGREHHDYFHRHFVIKGQEAARTCLDTVAKLQALPMPLAAPAL